MGIVKNKDLTPYREKVLREELFRIVETIKKEYQPEKIILFGSLASKNINEWSDIDLLIVKETTKRPVERCLEVAKLIQPKVGIDLFIYTPEEYEALLREKFSFLLSVLKTGEVIYEKRV